MNLKIEICFVMLTGFIILGCKDRIKNPNKDTVINVSESNLTPIKIDSTIELVDSFLTKDYKVKLEEFINFDSNAFKLTIIKDGIKETQILDLPPGRTSIENCSKELIYIRFSLWWSLFKQRFYFCY